MCQFLISKNYAVPMGTHTYIKALIKQTLTVSFPNNCLQPNTILGWDGY